jgi:hypothetical protein
MFPVVLHVVLVTVDIITIVDVVFQIMIGVNNWIMMTAIFSIVAAVVVEVVPECVVAPTNIQIIPSTRFFI